MTSTEKVITINGRLENLGAWDYKPYQHEIINRPFPGPLEAPEDWDYQITYEERYANPLPEGAVEEELEVFFDRDGTLRRVDQAAEFELATRLAEASVELNDLMIDITLGLATAEQIERAKTLRALLKSTPV